MHVFEKETWQQGLSKTGFFVSLGSYIVFFLADLLRPGFVARYFSVHFFLIATVIFATWWLVVMKKYRDRVIWQYLLVIITGLGLAILTWKTGQGFGQMRVLLTALSIFVPVIILRIIRSG